MDENKLQRYFVFILFLFITFFFFHTTAVVSAVAADGDEKGEHYIQVEERKMPIIDAVKRMFSLPTTPSNYLMRVLQYFSPPNLDFRGVDEERASEEGTTEKVKEAVVKSVDTSKTAVQDSAKSAAKFAEEAVGETVGKVKRTLSGDHEEEL
ncbi:unnamed protein product [Fraxinus pennsylvanica]|uniref:Transmembrane protein n=1 Tax=Fraxinus pennsylvanica TaxID=56036 RepID=A0AAD1YPA1_9LAMI|nr:unnamed protein product [Fraxinus pennsylvanica]